LFKFVCGALAEVEVAVAEALPVELDMVEPEEVAAPKIDKLFWLHVYLQL
jgi:hypothetical protein